MPLPPAGCFIRNPNALVGRLSVGYSFYGFIFIHAEYFVRMMVGVVSRLCPLKVQPLLILISPVKMKSKSWIITPLRHQIVIGTVMNTRWLAVRIPFLNGLSGRGGHRL